MASSREVANFFLGFLMFVGLNQWENDDFQRSVGLLFSFLMDMDTFFLVSVDRGSPG